jgi:hypothetical protein
MSVLLQLGGFTFEMSGVAPRAITRTDEWRWAETERLSGANALQFLGRGPGEMTLEAVLFPRHRGGHSEVAVDALRIIASQGVPLPFIRGDYRMLGFYVIGMIEEDHAYIDRHGRPQMLSLIITLRRYGLDGLTGFSALFGI